LFKDCFGNITETIESNNSGLLYTKQDIEIFKDCFGDIFIINNSDFEEAEHPRDDAGKFTDKDAGTSTTPPSEKQIEIKGDELGEYKDTKELRQKAVDYYKKNLAGTYVNHNKIGKITFTLSGYKKPISFSADKRKLLLFPYLPEIIKNGVIDKEEKDNKGRADFSWVILKSKIKLGIKEEEEKKEGKKEEVVRVNIRKDDDGNLYYDHVINKNPSGSAYNVSQSQISNSIIKNDEYIVNLFIKDENGKWI